MENYLHSFNISLVYFSKNFIWVHFPLYIYLLPLKTYFWLEVLFLTNLFEQHYIAVKCNLNNSYEKLLRELSWIRYWINIWGKVSRKGNKARGMILPKTKIVWLSHGALATFLTHPWDSKAHIQYQFMFLVILMCIWCGSMMTFRRHAH